MVSGEPETQKREKILKIFQKSLEIIKKCVSLQPVSKETHFKNKFIEKTVRTSTSKYREKRFNRERRFLFRPYGLEEIEEKKCVRSD